MATSRCFRYTFVPATTFLLSTTAALAVDASDSVVNLEEVTVTGQREHYRGDVSVADLPQAVQIISADTLEEVGAVRLNDALDLAAGVARQNTFGGVWDAFAIRGFAGDLNTPSGYLVNGFNGGRGFGGLRDTSSIERIEVLKGPGSALFGRGEPGGTVSITTKKPQFTTQGSVGLSAGSYNFYRGEGDFTTPLNDAVAVRINGAVEDADSFRDTVHQRRYFGSPSVLAKLGDDTSLWYELEWSRQEIPFDRGVVARNGVLGVIPNSRYLGEPGDGPNIAKALGHQAELQHTINSNWTLLVGGAYRDTRLTGYGENPELVAGRQPFLSPTNPANISSDYLSRQRRYQDYDSNDTVGRVEMSGSLFTGALQHHLLFGADYEKFKLIRYQSRYRPPAITATTTVANLNAVNIFNPVYGSLPNTTPGSTPNSGFVFNDTENDKAYGIYLTDQIDLTDQFKVRLGARYDWFKQDIANRLTVVQPPSQDVTAFSPQVGLIYQPTEVISFYTAFAKGFRPNTGFDVNRQPFEPEDTTSYEVGTKFVSPDKKLTGTLAVFSMKKTNVITADPVNSGFSVAIGEAKSKGVELELSGELPAQFRIMFSYAYTDAESATSVLDPDFRKVVAAGDPLINIPKTSGNLLLFKDFNVAAERQLSIGAGVNYVGRRLGETGTTFYLPAYTLVKLLASYDVTEKLSINGQVNNLFDKQYYPASYSALWIAPGAPRQFLMQAAYKF